MLGRCVCTIFCLETHVIGLDIYVLYFQSALQVTDVQLGLRIVGLQGIFITMHASQVQLIGHVYKPESRNWSRRTL
jgi:hypothetical protein